ncbi:helix-turn-helix domain-containing protein [Calothrix sp. CCY 0018]|uniref:helix-turn-helix domain-containing protein n=1 Tax=Calothrix sp. CCY 0018 TaxID=3103864 RepID=UPI0039C6C73F
MSDSKPIFDPNYSEETDSQLLSAFQRKFLLNNLYTDLPSSYRQRIEIMLLADEGKSQAEICRTLGCSPATVRYWMHIARSGMAHQWQDCPIGRPKVVNDEYLQRLQELLKGSPRDYGYSFQRWTTNWLSKHLFKELGIQVSDRHIKRLLKQLGLSTRSKPNTCLDSTTETKSSKISIRELKSASLTDSVEFLPLHFTKLETVLEIDDGQ